MVPSVPSSNSWILRISNHFYTSPKLQRDAYSFWNQYRPWNRMDRYYRLSLPDPSLGNENWCRWEAEWRIHVTFNVSTTPLLSAFIIFTFGFWLNTPHYNGSWESCKNKREGSSSSWAGLKSFTKGSRGMTLWFSQWWNVEHIVSLIFRTWSNWGVRWDTLNPFRPFATASFSPVSIV